MRRCYACLSRIVEGEEFYSTSGEHFHKQCVTFSGGTSSSRRHRNKLFARAVFTRFGIEYIGIFQYINAGDANAANQRALREACRKVSSYDRKKNRASSSV